MPPWLVCIVDDSASVRRALDSLLRAGGFEVAVFTSGEEFLQSGLQPQCLLLDVDLGRESGFDVYERLIASGTAPPVIFMTAHDETWMRERARRAGAIDYLRKPFTDSALFDAIRKAAGIA